jgi:hypothetical protein
MDNLVVNHQLTATIIDDQCPNTSSAICEGCINLAIKATLINDSQALLDIASLGHADDQTIPAHVEDAILLVDWAEHALYIDAGLRVAHEGALFLKLAGEEIHAQVSVLTSLWRGSDADDLARTPLKDYEITDADELARDCDGAGWEAAARLDEADLLTDAFSHAGWTTSFIFDDHLFTVMVTEWVNNAVGGTLEATAEGVVFALVVVVTHVVAAGSVDLDVFFFDLDFFGRSATFVLDVVGRIDAAAVVALGYVKLGLEALVSCLSAVDVDVDSLIVSAAAVVALGYVKLGLVSCLSAIDVNVDSLIVSAAAVVAFGYVNLVLEALVSCLSAVDVNIDSLVVSAAAAFDVDVDLGVSVFSWFPVTNNSSQHVFFGRRLILGTKQT